LGWRVLWILPSCVQFCGYVHQFWCHRIVCVSKQVFPFRGSRI